MKFLRLAMLLLLAIMFLACESADDKADEETRSDYTGADNPLSTYIGSEKDENGNPIYEENNDVNLAADYHREDGKHTDFREINKYQEVVNNGFGGSTIVARVIIKEYAFSSTSPINKLTITPQDENNSWIYEAKFTPNPELFPNRESVTAKSGKTLTFDFGNVNQDVGGSQTSNFGLLELYAIFKEDPSGDVYDYDYFAVLNQ